MRPLDLTKTNGKAAMTAPVTFEYHCSKCKKKTSPPVAPARFVLCPCGYMTSQSAAERVVSTEAKAERKADARYAPHAVAYTGRNNLDLIAEKGHTICWIASNAYWLENKLHDWVTPLFGEAYVSGLVDEIKNLQGRLTMVESYENEFARLLREAEAERDLLREQLINAGIQPQSVGSKVDDH